MTDKCTNGQCIQIKPITKLEMNLDFIKLGIERIETKLDTNNERVTIIEKDYVTKEHFNKRLSSYEQGNKPIKFTVNNILRRTGTFLFFLVASSLGNNFGNILQWFANLFK